MIRTTGYASFNRASALDATGAWTPAIKRRPVPGLTVLPLLETETATIRDIGYDGACKGPLDQDWPDATQLVFPYRGLFVCHVTGVDVVAEANQVLFFNKGKKYSFSHPVDGGAASLSLSIKDDFLRELIPKALLPDDDTMMFGGLHRRIDPRAQALVALLRHSLNRHIIEVLEAETLALTLIRRALGERTSHVTKTSYGRQKLVDRTKLILASDLARRWTLAEIAAEVGVSPVYLTQVFRQVEEVPLYRYQLRLRLARALDLLGQADDLMKLGLDLGFSSHSHFSAAFRWAYGRSPAEFQRSLSLR
jgi:AraC-like DNA-binding protein